MVVHDQATISLGDFSFQRTIAAIRNSSGGSATTDAALAQSITTGLTATSFPNPVSGLPMPANPRTDEANLTGAGLLAQMQPIALFNRFDAAPADGSNCGEYRIVYGRYPASTLDRFLLIFEARLPNPTPALGIDGCLPVAQFWHELSDPGLTDLQRAQQLENFYYNGLPGFSPVVSHANYGMPLGQVRSNMFMEFEWQLREWRTTLNGSGQAEFAPDTVKDNPLTELYDETSTNPNPGLFTTEQAAFLSDFTGNRMNRLMDFELNGSGITACPEVNAVGAGFLNRFNEFQSHSQPNSDDPRLQASASFKTSIDGVLSGNPAFAGLTDDHVLNRAGTVTCGGCHQFSVGDAISPTANWPGVAPGGFAHVRELGASSPTNAPPAISQLSPALNNCFLPARQQILETFVCDAGGTTDAGVTDASSDAGTVDSGTVDAGTVDAGNPVACGGPYGATCGATEYCEFGLYNICGVNGPGICTPRPTGCAYSGNQVCGCDGATYPNECQANAAGTDVSSTGACGGSCTQRPRPGCCFEDSQCSHIKGGECVGEVCSSGQAGVCKGPTKTGQCWEQDDCGRGQQCVGANICPCGAKCLVPDSPGTCQFVLTPAPIGPAPIKSALSTASATPVSAVESAKQEVLRTANTAASTKAVEDLKDAVEAERAREAAQPGAFRRQRRTH